MAMKIFTVWDLATTHLLWNNFGKLCISDFYAQALLQETWSLQDTVGSRLLQNGSNIACKQPNVHILANVVGFLVQTEQWRQIVPAHTVFKRKCDKMLKPIYSAPTKNFIYGDFFLSCKQWNLVHKMEKSNPKPRSQNFLGSSFQRNISCGVNLINSNPQWKTIDSKFWQMISKHCGIMTLKWRNEKQLCNVLLETANELLLYNPKTLDTSFIVSRPISSKCSFRDLTNSLKQKN